MLRLKALYKVFGFSCTIAFPGRRAEGALLGPSVRGSGEASRPQSMSAWLATTTALPSSRPLAPGQKTHPFVIKSGATLGPRGCWVFLWALAPSLTGIVAMRCDCSGAAAAVLVDWRLPGKPTSCPSLAGPLQRPFGGSCLHVVLHNISGLQVRVFWTNSCSFKKTHICHTLPHG